MDYLVQEQKSLLFRLVREDRSARAEKRDRLLIAIMMNAGRDQIIGGSAPIEADYSDVLALLEAGYLTTVTRGSNQISFSVAPSAYRLYDQQAPKEPIEQLAQEIVEYVQRELPPAFDASVKLIEEAGALVWGASTQSDLTSIGHKVREALQSFSGLLYDQYCSQYCSGPQLPKNQTRNKIAAVATQIGAKLGDTDRKLLAAAVAFWEATDMLAQKVEHGTASPARPLESSDAKRLVLLAHVVTAELFRLASSSGTTDPRI